MFNKPEISYNIPPSLCSSLIELFESHDIEYDQGSRYSPSSVMSEQIFTFYIADLVLTIDLSRDLNLMDRYYEICIYYFHKELIAHRAYFWETIEGLKKDIVELNKYDADLMGTLDYIKSNFLIDNDLLLEHVFSF